MRFVLERKIAARDATQHHLNGRDPASAYASCSSGRGAVPAQLQRQPSGTGLMMMAKASGTRLAAAAHAAPATQAVGAHSDGRALARRRQRVEVAVPPSTAAETV